MQDWKAGDPCIVDGKHIGREKGKMYDATVLDTAFSSEGDYLQTKLSISSTAEAFGQKIHQTWTHPKPVQSYKLRRPYLKDKNK